MNKQADETDPRHPLSDAAPDNAAGMSNSFVWRMTLLVAVLTAVGGLLFYLTVPRFPKGGLRKETAAAADIASLELALRTFQTDTGRYPSSADGLIALVNAPANATKWKGPDVRRIPLDPWGVPYQFESPGSHHPGTCDLFSIGPDRVFGTADDIANWKINGR